MRRWLHDYLYFGETSFETRHRMKKLRLHKRAANWTREDLDQLRTIVDEDPDMYRDEIQRSLLHSLDKLFSTSSIRKTLYRMGYSLKVAYEKAGQRDRSQFI